MSDEHGGVEVAAGEHVVIFTSWSCSDAAEKISVTAYGLGRFAEGGVGMRV